MKRLYFGFSLLFLAGCVHGFHSYWNVRHLVLSPDPVIDLATQENRVLLSVDKRTLGGVGLGLAGVPAAGVISGFGADLIESSFSRDDERDADAWGIDYMTAAGSDPWAAVRLHEKLLASPGGGTIPFLSSHPSGQERIENLRQIIEAKKRQGETSSDAVGLTSGP